MAWRIVFLLILLIHGFIHLLGFVKAFRLAEIEALNTPITKPMGIVWLLVVFLFIITAIAYFVNHQYWITLGFIAIVLSQIVIVTAWQDAKVGTIANVAILIPLLIGLDQNRFKQDAYKLLISDIPVSTSRIADSELQKLPTPVQRYYRYAVKDTSTAIRNARLKYSGKFRTYSKTEWMEIEGEQYFSVITPGFIWKGTTTFLTANDRYVNGKGDFKVKLLSLISIVRAKGTSIDEAELQRWIAENFWFPINFFTNKHFSWNAIDQDNAELVYTDLEYKIPFIVSFNESGQLLMLETKRFMADDRKEVWRGYASDYKEFHGMMIPTTVEAVWVLEGEEYSYGKFSVEELEYNSFEVF